MLQAAEAEEGVPIYCGFPGTRVGEGEQEAQDVHISALLLPYRPSPRPLASTYALLPCAALFLPCHPYATRDALHVCDAS